MERRVGRGRERERKENANNKNLSLINEGKKKERMSE